MPNFNFLEVIEQKGLDAIKASGLVGLSPEKFDADADLFVLKMKEGGAIDEAVFSMSIASGEDTSKITFGGYDEANFATGKITWHYIDMYAYHW